MPAFAAPVPPDLDARLDVIFAKRISHDSPGCALGVRHGEFELQRAWGQADLERDVALTPQNMFNIGSVTKQVTAMAVLLLARDGKLALDDDVRKYVPELPVRERTITIDQLLNHTSGMRDFRGTDWILGRDVLPVTNADVLDYAARQRSLNHPPGESYSYTNTGYVLAALIVERASGQSLADFTRTRLFMPAGMQHTQWEEEPERLVPNRAAGYHQVEPPSDGKPARFAQRPTTRRTIGNGGVLSTVGDMLRWNAALSGDAFGPGLTAQLEQLARLRNGYVLDYARGIFIHEYRGLREVHHTGYTGTYSTRVSRYPQADLSIVLLCNGDGDDVDPRNIADLFLPDDQQAPAAPGSKATRTADLSAYSGVYRDPSSGDLTMLEFPKDAQLTGDRLAWEPITYVFDPAKPDRIVQELYGKISTWERLRAEPSTAASLGDYAGRYDSDELLGGFVVRLDGTQLSLSVHGLSFFTVPLQPVAQDVFLAQEIRMPVGFRRDAHGRIMSLTLSPSRLRGWTFERMNGAKERSQD